MKKYSLAFGLMLLMAAPAFAQGRKRTAETKPTTVTAAPVMVPGAAQSVSVTPASDAMALPAEGTPTGSLTVDNMQFETENHNFGTVAEGPTADYTFTFVNTGKEPIVIQRVQPACGCTAADWSKEPVMPGEKGFAKAVYNTQGRPGKFNKTVTVLTNAGAKVLSFMGEVEQAPPASVPANNSMMKTQ